MKTFEELGVVEEIRRAIEELGFVQPMPVQEEVIPYLLGNRNDVIALAQTGTGKIPKEFRTPQGDWRELMKGASFKLRGEEPDFSEEGWARRKPKRK